MMDDATLIRAYVEVPNDDDLPVLTFGQYRFVTLPRVGEVLDIKFGEGRKRLRVIDVTHGAYGVDDTPTPWDAIIVLSCELLNAED